MSLGMDAAWALPQLRAAAESLMSAQVVITRPGAQTYNATTKQYDAATVTVYTGPGRVRPYSHRDQRLTVADQVFTSGPHILSLPVEGSEGVEKDDIVTVTAADDPGLVGRSFTIVFASAYSHGTARRFPLRETQ